MGCAPPRGVGLTLIVADRNFAPMYARRARRVQTDRRDARTLADQHTRCLLECHGLRSTETTERPHDALGGDTPASRYTATPRPYPERPPVPEYPGHFLVKRVTDAGTFRFQHRLLYIANALVNQHIGLEETDDGVWAIYFTTVLLATLDERDFVVRG